MSVISQQHSKKMQGFHSIQQYYYCEILYFQIFPDKSHDLTELSTEPEDAISLFSSGLHGGGELPA